jgi:hypothetical protein
MKDVASSLHLPRGLWKTTKIPNHNDCFFFGTRKKCLTFQHKEVDLKIPMLSKN